MNIIQVLMLKAVGLHKEYVDMCSQNAELKLMAMKEHDEMLSLRTSLDHWKGLQAQTAKERDAELNKASEYRDRLKLLQSDLDKMTASRDELSAQYHKELDASKALIEQNKDLREKNDILLCKVEKLELQLAEVGEEKQKLAQMLVEEQKRFANSKRERLHQRDVIAKLQQQIKSESDE